MLPSSILYHDWLVDDIIIAMMQYVYSCINAIMMSSASTCYSELCWKLIVFSYKVFFFFSGKHSQNKSHVQENRLSAEATFHKTSLQHEKVRFLFAATYELKCCGIMHWQNCAMMYLYFLVLNCDSLITVLGMALLLPPVTSGDIGNK